MRDSSGGSFWAFRKGRSKDSCWSDKWNKHVRDQTHDEPLALCLTEVIGIRNIWGDASFVLIGCIAAVTANVSFSIMTSLRALIK